MNNSSIIDKFNHVYRISSRVVFEGFEEGALVLRLEDRHLFELNLSAFGILAKTDDVRNAADIAFSFKT